MNEADAKTVCFVKVIETSPLSKEFWAPADSQWASQCAAQIVGEDASAERFIGQRAKLAWERVGERQAHLKRLQSKSHWYPWVSWSLVLIAFFSGVVIDHIGQEKRINLLAFPLLGLLVWNLAVYVVLITQPVIQMIRRKPKKEGWIRRVLMGLGRGSAGAGKGNSTVAILLSEWLHLSHAVSVARAARALHWAAAAFGVGVIVSLYVRGIFLEYHAGWESTFLDASDVHGILSFVFGPVSAQLGTPMPDMFAIDTMRFSNGGLAEASSWIHRIALTLGIVVVMPRVLLAALSTYQQRRLEGHFPLDLGGEYYQRLLRGFKRQSARVTVVPYSYQLSPQLALGQQAILKELFGPNVVVSIADDIPFGGEDDVPEEIFTRDFTLLIVLFSLTSTPEKENHGVLLSAIRERIPEDRSFVAVVDESQFHLRFPEQHDRLEARRRLWSEFLGGLSIKYVMGDLTNPDQSGVCTAFESCLNDGDRQGRQPIQ